MPRVRTGACALALGVVAAATASAAPAPSSGGWIVYPRYAPSDAGAQILSASVRGGEQRLLVRGTSLAAGVALSRNGKRIAFVRKGRAGRPCGFQGQTAAARDVSPAARTLAGRPTGAGSSFSGVDA